MTWKNQYNLNRKEYLLTQQRLRRQELKTKKLTVASANKYYSAESIKILLSLKEYTELNKQTKKLWLDFAWTLQDCQQGVSDIITIMKLEQVANILIRDYWQTAKQEQKQNKASWNSLTSEQQSKLIAYWAKQKLRQDKHLLTELEQ